MKSGGRVILVTGSNLGDRKANLDRARDLVGERCGKIVNMSKYYDSKPWGEVEGLNGRSAGDFLNQALELETELEPEELLLVLQEIEREMGRQKYISGNGRSGRSKYLSRIIDIDIIFYGDRVIDYPNLTIPHPLMAEREFVLLPVAEIAREARHPLTGITVGNLLEKLREKY